MGRVLLHLFCALVWIFFWFGVVYLLIKISPCLGNNLFVFNAYFQSEQLILSIVQPVPVPKELVFNLVIKQALRSIDLGNLAFCPNKTLQRGKQTRCHNGQQYMEMAFKDDYRKLKQLF